MSDPLRVEMIERPAAKPDADLACEFEIAKSLADEGFRERLAGAIVGRPRNIAHGVALTFRAGAWDDVRRYIDVESRCCPFLDLAATKYDDGVELRVTGRPEALDFIRNIFNTPDDCS